jgi:ATP-binding cassette subfamily C (CFTR/MRP) protein 1
VGTTVNRFSQDLTVFDIELPYRFVDFSLSGVEVIMAAVLMCVSAKYFAATLPAVAGIVYLLQKYYLRTSRQIRLLDLEAKSPLVSLTAIDTLR